MKNTPLTSSQTFKGCSLAAASFAYLLTAGNVSAALIAYEDFDYSGGTNLTTTTLNNGTGWDDAWQNTGAGVLGLLASGSGQSLYFDQTPSLVSDGSTHIFSEGNRGNKRDFTGSVSLGSQDLYASVLLRGFAGDTTDGASDADFRLQFHAGAGATGNMRANAGISNGTLFADGTAGGYLPDGSDQAASGFVDDVTYLFVMKRTNQTIFASLIEADGNPATLAAEPVSWQVSDTLASGVSLTSLRFLSSGDNDGGLRFDELRIATDWDSAVGGLAIPEPGAYALFGGVLALGAVAMRRRR